MSNPPTFVAPDPEELRELLPAYAVDAFVAQGGMGAVYRAHQKSLDRPVAIKILPREFGRDADFRSRFEAEAKAMAKVNHPNLISVHDFGEVDDMPYIVMEYVDGKSLHHSAHGKAIDQQEAGRLALGICEGLAHAHEADIIHRDIKPANILLDSKARPKIGDFGLARAVESTEGDSIIFGTPGYTAPEVIKNPDSVDKRSDVFSTGAILYELLTGELPGSPYVPASQRGAVDPRFDKIIRRATHPSPSLRYADGAAMAADLRPLLEALQKPGAALVTRAPATSETSSEGTVAKAATPATPAAGAGEAAADQPRPVMASEVSSAHSWSMLRNLLIIGVLLAAIAGMWQLYKAKQARNDKKVEEHRLEQERIAQERAAKAEADRVAARERAGKDKPETGSSTTTPTPRPDPKPVIPAEPETPREALARLQSALAGGKRNEFPEGTESRGEQRYFFIDAPMTWQDATAFAEAHGAHLATCPSEADKLWLGGKSPEGDRIWVGGGAVGRDDWGWVDGTEWDHRKPSTTTGTAASLTSLGTLQAKPPGEHYPFFLQWSMDGRNAGSLESQLARVRESRSTPNPAFPPGSFFMENRRYLLVARPTTWAEAARLAELGDGFLAVPSEQTEIDFLKKVADENLKPTEALWLGGQHNGRAWAWATGEAWNLAAWAEGSPDGDPSSEKALRLVAGRNGGWDDAKPDDQSATSALLIEWSKDHEAKTTVAGPAMNDELARIRSVGMKALEGYTSDYIKELKNTGKSFRWDLDFWYRGLAEGPKARVKPGLDLMKQSIRDDGSIPGDIPRRGMPAEAAKVLDGYLDKQVRTEAAYLKKVEGLRQGYLKELAEARTGMEERGLKAQMNALDNEVSACGNEAASFIEHLSGEPHLPPGRPQD